MPISLGDINFNISANSRDLETGMKLMTTFGNKVEKVARSQVEGAEKTAKALARQERAISSALQKTADLTSRLNRMGASADVINRVETSFKAYSNQLSRTEVKALTLQRANIRLEASLKSASREAATASFELNKLRKEEAATARAASDAAKQQDMHAKKMSILAASARELQQTQSRIGAVNTGGLEGLRKLNEEFSRQDAVRNYRQELLSAGVSLRDADARTRQYATALNTLAAAQANANKNTRHFTGLMRDSLLILSAASGPAGFFAAQTVAIADALSSAGVGSRKTNIALGATAVSVGAVGKAMITTAIEVDKIRAAFTSMTHSTSLSNRLMEEARDIANTSGQSFTVTAGQYAKFTAAARGTSMAGEEAKETFKTLAIVTGQLQLPAEQTEGIFRAVEQIMSKGKVQAEELRNQLGDRLPGAFQIAADAMGVTSAGLSDMLKKGQVLSEDFLPKFRTQLEKVFNVNKEVDSLQASLARLGNANMLFLGSLDSSLGVSSAFKSIIEGITVALNFLAVNMNVVIPLIAAMTTAFVVMNISTVIAGISSLAGVIGGALVIAVRTVTASIIAFNAALFANPIAGIISLLWRLVAVLGSAALAYYGFSEAINDTTVQMDQLNNETNDFIKMNARIGATGGLGGNLIDRWKDTASEAASKIKSLTEEIKVLEKSPGRNALASFTSVRGLQDAQDELRQQKMIAHQAKTAIDKLNVSQEEAASKMLKFAPTTSTGSSFATPKMPKMPKMAKIPKLQEDTKEVDLREIELKLERMAAAGAKAGTQISNLKQRLTTLKTDGLEGLERLNQEFEMQDALKDYAALLKEAGLSAEETSKRVRELSATQREFDLQLEEARRQKAIADEVNDSFSRAYDSIGDSLADMVMRGELEFSKLRDVAREALTDIAKTFFKLGVVNPIKQSIQNAFNPGESFTESMNRSNGGSSLSNAARQFTSMVGNSFASNGGGTHIFGGSNARVNAAQFTNSLFGADAAREVHPGFVADNEFINFDTGQVEQMRLGGIINAPTMFNKGTSHPVIGGEAGSEAIMPLTRLGNGELGVRAMGGGSQPVNVTISTPSPEAFKRSKTQIASTLRKALGSSGKNRRI